MEMLEFPHREEETTILSRFLPTRGVREFAFQEESEGGGGAGE